jgi:succinoglycan biosynthesis protein ExoV
MQLEYFRHPIGNFGDDLNTWIWDALLPGWQEWDDTVTLIGVGTLLNEEQLATFRDRRILVIGSGVGYGSRPPRLPLPLGWDIRAVRGPLSAGTLGLPKDRGVIDPAALLPDLPEFQGIRKSGPPIFIPHISTARRHDWDYLCRRAGLDFVAPDGEARAVIGRIAAAPLVIAESMHAAIIADTFRVPWIPVRFSAQFHAEKWQDWAASLGMTIAIPSLFPLLDKLRALRRLSRGSVLQPRQPTTFCGEGGAMASPPALSRPHSTLLQMMMVQGLRRTARRRPCLSDPDILRQKQQAYRKILRNVIHDYAARPV